ncbi:MAG: HD domain-containing protein [Chitinophagaceae bacterium]|nr:HD domain-containing protein [Chitinophagaceae bacterium]
MEYNNTIYKKIENYVTSSFEKNNDQTLIFHSLRHTEIVVKRTKEISAHYNLGEKEMLIVYAAAWFHDTGHLFGDAVGHEDISVKEMHKFMDQQTDDKDLTDQIEQCILATKAPRNPSGLLQQIICDADTYHLGTKDFKFTNKLAFEEEKLKKGTVDKVEFNKSTLMMLEKHVFFTTYCKELLTSTKEKNMKKLKKKNADAKTDNTPVTEPDEPANFSGLEKDKSGLMSKGIQTMLRLASENHLKLSDMADHKANILISVNSIIISVILSVLLRKLQEETWLMIPTIIFLLVAVTTIVISILATRPKITGGTFSHQDIADKKTNLLFFGNFHKASFEEYNIAMRAMMVDTDYLYGSLIKDIYHLGVVLGRKYKLIRLAYNIFMIGIIVSVLAFAIAVAFSHPGAAGSVTNGSGSPL